MDIGTGMFTAPLAGTYQFIIQAFKVSHFGLIFYSASYTFPNLIFSSFFSLQQSVAGRVRIKMNGNEWPITGSYDLDDVHAATLSCTVIITLVPGQMVIDSLLFMFHETNNNTLSTVHVPL